MVFDVVTTDEGQVSKIKAKLQELLEIRKKIDFSPFNRLHIQSIILSNNRTELKESDLNQVQSWLEKNREKLFKMAGVWQDYPSYGILDRKRQTRNKLKD